jgi:hypothetical protein
MGTIGEFESANIKIRRTCINPAKLAGDYLAHLLMLF